MHAYLRTALLTLPFVAAVQLLAFGWGMYDCWTNECSNDWATGALSMAFAPLFFFSDAVPEIGMNAFLVVLAVLINLFLYTAVMSGIVYGIRKLRHS